MKVDPHLHILVSLNQGIEVLQAILQSGRSSVFLQVKGFRHTYGDLRENSKHANADHCSFEPACVLILFREYYSLEEQA